jgi:hypothetical protein
MIFGTLTIEQRLTDAFVRVLLDTADIADTSVIPHNDPDTLPTKRTIRVRAETARPSEIDAYSGTLWECDVHIEVTTSAADDVDGQFCLDGIGQLRDTVYASTFLASLNAEISGLSVDAVMLTPDASDDAEDTINAYAMLAQCKLQTT